jgi:hypothetical protein
VHFISERTDEESCIGGLLLRHILQLVCNAHAITELQVCISILTVNNSKKTSYIF